MHLALLATVSAFSLNELFHAAVDNELDAPQQGEMRLIEFEGGVRQWVTEDELLDTLRSSIRFFDVTGREDVVTAKAEVEFPKKVHQTAAFDALAGNLSEHNLISTLTEFSGFYTRYAKSEHGLNSSLWLHEQVKEIAADRDDISVELFDHEWQQKSLIARFAGETEDVVVVGAHQDSINLVMPSILPAPGADDDGSGTVTILEVFRVLAESGYTPRNTLEFHWYSAEELGLLGSQDVFEAYAKDKRPVKAMLQQDMTGYSAGSLHEDGSDSLGLIVDYVDPGLTEFIKLVVDSYCDIPFVETTCGYACSDHASASKHGYPSAFVIEADFKSTDHFIHTTRDTLDKLDFKHMLQHTKLTLGYALELGAHKF